MEMEERPRVRPLEPRDQKPAKKEKSMKKLIHKFMGYTTAHGIGRLGDAKNIFWRLFWAAVCMGAFGMFIFQVWGLFKLYLSKPVATSVKITFEKVRLRAVLKTPYQIMMLVTFTTSKQR